MNTKSEVSLAQDAHVAERNNICGIRVILEVESARFVFITLTADGAIQRLGMCTPDGPERNVLSGSTSPILFQKVRHRVSSALLQWRGQSWSDPVVIARSQLPTDSKQRRWIAYPYVFEHQPGKIWLTTMQGDLRVELLENEFVD